MVVGGFATGVVNAYSAFLALLPEPFQIFINLFLLVLLIVIYAVFIWKLYRFISNKNIFGFNLSKYNTTEHPFLIKLFATFLYLLEYILIVPFIIFLWFAIFTLFLIVLTESLTLQQILIVAATVIAATRMTSYIPKYGQDLSREIAKFIPFALLTISLLEPNFFSFERVLGHFTQIGAYFSLIFNYLIFIVVLEVVLRFFDFLFGVFGLDEESETGEENVVKED
jgi:hypothetical protein